MAERMTTKDFLALTSSNGDKRRVRGAEPVFVDGIRFDSKKEARRWQDLKVLERAGHITNLRRQVPIALHGRDGPILTSTGLQMKSRIDFAYNDTRLNGALVYEDAKGFQTDESKLKFAILAAQNIEVLIT